MSTRVNAVTGMLGVKRNSNGNRVGKGEREEDGTTDEPTYCQCNRVVKAFQRDVFNKI